MLPAALRVLSDASTGLPTSGEQVAVLTAVVGPIVAGLAGFARWTMKQNEKLQAELSEAYKSTIPVVQQSLATQRDMVDGVKALTALYAEERSRGRGR